MCWSSQAMIKDHLVTHEGYDAKPTNSEPKVSLLVEQESYWMTICLLTCVLYAMLQQKGALATNTI